MESQACNFIGGKWVPAQSGGTFETRNPATGQVIAHCADSGVEDIRAAVAAAREAFESWHRLPAPQRGAWLYRVAERLVHEKEALAHVLTSEMGKVLVEARGDVQEAIDMAYYMGGEGRRQFGHSAPAELPNKSASSIREPLGVVGLITPWNFPSAIPAWKSFPALIMGNTVVLKPSPDTPFTAALFVRILDESGIPPGVVNLVLGSTPQVGEALVKHPDVALISFTGSKATGAKVALDAATHHKRVALEMGGKNAILVMEDANLELAVEGIVWSAFGTTGQRCTACSRLIVHRAVTDRLVTLLLDRMKTLRVGNGLNPETDVGPLINQSQRDHVHDLVKAGQQEGARLLAGGHSLTEGEYAAGSFFAPTLFDKVTPSMRIANEEIFGPVLSVLEVQSLDEAIALNNSVEYGLSSALYTQDVNRAQYAMRELHAGIVYINAGTIGSEVHLPFGGVKATGNGYREAGQAALDTFSEWKSIYVDYSGQLQRAQIDTT
ncbi:MAG: aldehyde dehydrogenase family protein [Nitrospira sp.]|nr:aldehyde dehydrogenase family protein [Nitrospira sp.]